MVRRRQPDLRAAVLEAEAQLRSELPDGLTLLEVSALKLAARLAARIQATLPGDDPVRLADALERVSKLLPAPRAEVRSPRRYRLRVFDHKGVLVREDDRDLSELTDDQLILAYRARISAGPDLPTLQREQRETGESLVLDIAATPEVESGPAAVAAEPVPEPAGADIQSRPGTELNNRERRN
jgi:hypothetical protein